MDNFFSHLHVSACTVCSASASIILLSLQCAWSPEMSQIGGKKSEVFHKTPVPEHKSTLFQPLDYSRLSPPNATTWIREAMNAAARQPERQQGKNRKGNKWKRKSSNRSRCLKVHCSRRLCELYVGFFFSLHVLISRDLESNPGRDKKWLFLTLEVLNNSLLDYALWAFRQRGNSGSFVSVS